MRVPPHQWARVAWRRSRHIPWAGGLTSSTEYSETERLEAQSLCRGAECEIKLERMVGADGGESMPKMSRIFSRQTNPTSTLIIR